MGLTLYRIVVFYFVVKRKRLTTQVWLRHRTMKSGRRKAGRPLGSVPSNKLPSQLPDLAGKRFGKLTVVTGDVVRMGPPRKTAYLLTKCDCGIQSLKEFSSLISGKAGCRRCGQPVRFPGWLYRRCQAVKERCTNPKAPEYPRYGGLGIAFRFLSASDMALWVQTNLGLHRGLSLDRIDPFGDYEPGNLRYADKFTQAQNQRIPRRPQTFRWHAFRIKYPHIRYADSTLRRMLHGMSEEEIVAKYNQYSPKPKGVYGIYSAADPVIASRLKGSSFTTAAS